jgi:starch synthase
VRAVGGHADTVTDADADPGRGTGFTYRSDEAEDLQGAVHRAVHAWSDRKRWAAVVQRGMQLDLSWARAATAYGEVYRKAVGSAR